jgi:uncharacterized protein YndB with AHSA1/START domain
VACRYPFDNWTVVNDNSNQVVVKEVEMRVRREVDVQASPEEVWEALVTEEGRERWLDEPEREIEFEVLDAPNRLVWWWAQGQEPPTRVEFLIVASPAGSRVLVTESFAVFPIAMFAHSFALVLT